MIFKFSHIAQKMEVNEGQIANKSETQSTNSQPNAAPVETKSTEKFTAENMPALMKHLKFTEAKVEQLQNELKAALEKQEKFGQKTKAGMQSALDTLMQKWMDAIQPVEDEQRSQSCKDDFKKGLEKLVKNADEDHGVWRMIVGASALHERQIHDLDTLRAENTELRKHLDDKIGKDYRNADSRVDRKRPAETELSRADVEPDACSDMWAEFAADIGRF